MSTSTSMSDRCCGICAQRKQNSGIGSRAACGRLGIECYVQLADEKEFPHEGKLGFCRERSYRQHGHRASARRICKQGSRLGQRLVCARAGSRERALPGTADSGARPWPPIRDIKFVYVVGSDGIATRRNVELGASEATCGSITPGFKRVNR